MLNVSSPPRSPVWPHRRSRQNAGPVSRAGDGTETEDVERLMELSVRRSLALHQAVLAPHETPGRGQNRTSAASSARGHAAQRPYCATFACARSPDVMRMELRSRALKSSSSCLATRHPPFFDNMVRYDVFAPPPVSRSAPAQKSPRHRQRPAGQQTRAPHGTGRIGVWMKRPRPRLVELFPWAALFRLRMMCCVLFHGAGNFRAKNLRHWLTK